MATLLQVDVTRPSKTPELAPVRNRRNVFCSAICTSVCCGSSSAEGTHELENVPQLAPERQPARESVANLWSGTCGGPAQLKFACGHNSLCGSNWQAEIVSQGVHGHCGGADVARAGGYFFDVVFADVCVEIRSRHLFQGDRKHARKVRGQQPNCRPATLKWFPSCLSFPPRRLTKGVPFWNRTFLLKISPLTIACYGGTAPPSSICSPHTKGLLRCKGNVPPPNFALTFYLGASMKACYVGMAPVSEASRKVCLLSWNDPFLL